MGTRYRKGERFRMRSTWNAPRLAVDNSTPEDNAASVRNYFDEEAKRMSMPRPWKVGDVVRVERECLGHPPRSLALVVEVYDREAMHIGTGTGITLLFNGGEFDGFSVSDCMLFGVERIGHAPRFAGYRWISAVRLVHDWAQGTFDEVFRVWI